MDMVLLTADPCVAMAPLSGWIDLESFDQVQAQTQQTVVFGKLITSVCDGGCGVERGHDDLRDTQER